MKTHGFTLIEVICVLSLISLLTALSLPAFNSLMGVVELNTTATNIASDLRAAQIKAMASHFTHEIRFERNGYKILRDNFLEGKLEELKTVNLSRRLSFMTIQTLKFSAAGFPQPGGFGTITLKRSGGGSRKIIVSSVGRVRIE